VTRTMTVVMVVVVAVVVVLLPAAAAVTCSGIQDVLDHTDPRTLHSHTQTHTEYNIYIRAPTHVRTYVHIYVRAHSPLAAPSSEIGYSSSLVTGSTSAPPSGAMAWAHLRRQHHIDE
jgi:hypothetical protein